ncbi:Protein kinase C-binding protein NELL1, partial [Varanus komodoensis]
LNYAEMRLSQLENCHCEKTCQVNGMIYRDKDSWVEDDHCRNCTCKSGVVECRRMACPPLDCSPDGLPVHITGQCCKVCKSKCIYGGKVLAEGQKILTKNCRECRCGYGTEFALVALYDDLCGERNRVIIFVHKDTDVAKIRSAEIGTHELLANAKVVISPSKGTLPIVK